MVHRNAIAFPKPACNLQFPIGRTEVGRTTHTVWSIFVTQHFRPEKQHKTTGSWKTFSDCSKCAGIENMLCGTSAQLLLGEAWALRTQWSPYTQKLSLFMNCVCVFVCTYQYPYPIVTPRCLTHSYSCEKCQEERLSTSEPSSHCGKWRLDSLWTCRMPGKTGRSSAGSIACQGLTPACQSQLCWLSRKTYRTVCVCARVFFKAFVDHQIYIYI